MIHNMADLRLSLHTDDDGGGVRITKVNYVALGPDEEVLFPESLVVGVWGGDGGGGGDAAGNFGVRRAEGGQVEVLVEWSDGEEGEEEEEEFESPLVTPGKSLHPHHDPGRTTAGFAAKTASHLIKQFCGLLFETRVGVGARSRNRNKDKNAHPRRQIFPALLAAGPGARAGEIPSPPLLAPPPFQQIPIHYTNIYIPPHDPNPSSTSPSPAHACPPTILSNIPKDTDVVFILRGGGCKFSDKLSAIPFGARLERLRWVIFIDDGMLPTRPILDEPQPQPVGFELGAGAGEERREGNRVGVVMARGRGLVDRVFAGKGNVTGVSVLSAWEIWVASGGSGGVEVGGAGGGRRKVGNARVVRG